MPDRERMRPPSTERNPPRPNFYGSKADLIMPGQSRSRECPSSRSRRRRPRSDTMEPVGPIETPGGVTYADDVPWGTTNAGTRREGREGGRQAGGPCPQQTRAGVGGVPWPLYPALRFLCLLLLLSGGDAWRLWPSSWWSWLSSSPRAAPRPPVAPTPPRQQTTSACKSTALFRNCT